ncbi:MAG: DsbA family protein [Nitrososphaeraceae archaeon]
MMELELTLPVSSSRDHIQGPQKAPITLLEYGDYECPYCGQAFSIVKLVQNLLVDNLRFVFRNFPLTQIHLHAQHAAEAAECAGAQNRFWEMHDILYEHQQALEDEDLESYVELLKLDIPKFQSDLYNHFFADRVREDFLSGIRSGVNGTPTFYINGRRYNDSWDVETLTASLRSVIDKNKY